MHSEFVSVERHGAVVEVHLDRPKVNALDGPTLSALAAVLEAATRSDAGAVVLSGRPGAFSAGIDTRAVGSAGPAERAQMMRTVNRLCLAVYASPLPLVAALTGHAIGGGLVLALAAHQRIGVAGDAVYSLPEARAGVPFPAGAMAVLRAELSPAVARRLALCDLRLDGEAALAAGVLDQLAPADGVRAAAREAAERLASLPRPTWNTVAMDLRGPTIDRLRAIVDQQGQTVLSSQA